MKEIISEIGCSQKYKMVNTLPCHTVGTLQSIAGVNVSTVNTLPS